MRLVDADKEMQWRSDWILWVALNGKQEQYKELAEKRSIEIEAFRDAKTVTEPVVEQVPVIKCKDCKHSFSYSSDGWCRCTIGIRDMPLNGYCSFAKRKDEQ